MNTEGQPARIFLKPKEEEEIRQGFPWVFDNEIDTIKGDVPDGGIVEVLSKAGQFLGCGVINRKSKITVRLLSREREAFDTAFFIRRIENAAALRSLYFGGEDSYRLVFAEADFLPGLVVERLCGTDGRIVLVVQFLTLGVEVFREEILEALRSVCRPAGIFERSDVHVRGLEGLEECKGWIGSALEPLITICENGVLFSVDIENGQKTGYFLDQKFNRRAVAALCGGRRVLDAFTHTGSFALNAVHGGAKEVIAADISEEAVSIVNTNIALNKAGSVMKAVSADVFDLLKQYESAGECFDLVILDPPAFTKSAKMIEKAYGGYKEINLRAMRLLNPGGILVSCSCSHFFDETLFYNMIVHAARDAHCTARILEKRGASPDHPVLAGYPKSNYLKCAVMRIDHGGI